MNRPYFGDYSCQPDVTIDIEDVLEQCDVDDLFAFIVQKERDRVWKLIESEFSAEIEAHIEERT